MSPMFDSRQSVFFALFPDAETAARVAGLAQQLRTKEGLKGKLIEPECFHVTLHYLGDYTELPGSVVDRSRRAAETIVLPAFELGFEQVGSFPGKPGSNKPFVLRTDQGNTALWDLRQTLGQALTLSGLERWVEPAWTPHMTLLYDNKRVAVQQIAPLRWTVRKFVLVRSVPGESRYIREAAWPLHSPI